MAFSADIRRKIYAILQAGYYHDKEQLIDDLCAALREAGVFEAFTTLTDQYEEALNKVIKQSLASSDNQTVAGFLNKLSNLGLNLDEVVPIIESTEKNKEKENLVKFLAQQWNDSADEIKYIKDQKSAQTFIDFSLRYERQMEQIYSRTQKAEQVFSKFGQGNPQEGVDKYYTFFFMDQKGQELKNVITIADSQFEEILKKTSAFRLNLALYKDEKRQEILDKESETGNLEKLFQGLGYTAKGDINFQKILQWYGGTNEIFIGKNQALNLEQVKDRYNQLRLANERGIIRDLNNREIAPNRLTEMIFNQDVLDSLRRGQGYQFNTGENIGALVEGDYEGNGVSVSVKTSLGTSGLMQLMGSSSVKSFGNIFKDEDSFKRYANAKLTKADQQSQKQLSGVLTDKVTEELSKIGQGQDYLKQDFEKVIQNNSTLQALGITSDIILQLPEFKQIYDTARANQFQQTIGEKEKQFLQAINNDKEGFYHSVIDNYVLKSYNPKTNQPTQRLQSWINQSGYGTDTFMIDFGIPTEQEIQNSAIDSLQQTLDEQPPLIFDLNF